MENYLCLKTGVQADNKRMSMYKGENMLIHHKMGTVAPDNGFHFQDFDST